MFRPTVLLVAVAMLVGCGKSNNNAPADTGASADAGYDAAPPDVGDVVDVGEDVDAPIASGALTLDCDQYERSKLKCSADLRASDGTPVTGRSLSDFTVTEARLDTATSEVLESNVVTFEDAPSYQFDGPGFWEQSLSNAKTDIVFVTDASGSMSDQVGPIRAAIEGFATRLKQEHVDFRMRFVRMESTPSSILPFPFRSTMEISELLEEDLPLAVRSGSEGWRPSAGYDALMQAMGNPSDQAEFRPDARPLIVVISDTIPASVYGRYWYPPSSTSATAGAVKDRIARLEAERGGPIAIRYSIPPNAGTGSDRNVQDGYCGEDFTPRACEVGYDKFAQPLGTWPPTSDSLHQAVADLFDDDIAELSPSFSKYHFAWLINLDRGQIDESQTLRITVETNVDGGDVVAETELPAELQTGDLTVAVVGERGEAIEPVTFELYSILGNRLRRSQWDNTIRDGEETFEDIPCGEYLMSMTSSPVADYDVMRHGYLGLVDVCDEPRVELALPWSDRQADLSRARGLVDELAVWGPIDRPFDSFASDANSWLDTLDADGMNWEQYSGLKRLIVSLGGYVNTTGYADVEVKAAVRDFRDASTELRRLIRQLDDTKTSSKSAFDSPATTALLTYYSTPPAVNADAIEKYTLEDAAIQGLIDYLTGPFLTEVLTKVAGVIGDNVTSAQLATLVIQFATSLIQGEWDDLDDLIARIAQVGLQAALNETADQVSGFVGTLVANEIDDVADPEVTTAVKQLVKQAVSAILDVGLEALRSDTPSSVYGQLDTLAQTAKAELGGRENLVAAVDLVFAEVHSKLEYGPFRNFVWPMLHALVRALVEKSEVDSSFVLEALATQFANRLIVYPYYADPLADGLTNALAEAQGWQPLSDFHAEESALHSVGSDCRSDVMRPLNNDAWDVLATQSSIDDWESWMTTGRDILGVLEGATLAACIYYPELCDPATDEIPTLMNILSGLRVMTNIFQLAIRMNLLEETASRVRRCNGALFPVP